MRRGETPNRGTFLVGVAAATLVGVSVATGVSATAVAAPPLAETTSSVETADATRPTPADQTKGETPPNVSSTLHRLVDADDREAFASAHGIDLRDGRVVVVVELRGRSTLPDGYDATVQQTATVGGETFVQAWVPVDRVVPLAEEPGVAYVRLPDRADASGSASASAPSKGERTAAPDARSTARETDAREAESRPTTRNTDVLVVVVAVVVAVVAVGLYGRVRR
ncbi:hypothetical protein C2R22_09695 [Salinigranum rubrum]|uniref:Uncharacterized protein n=1 Tax=Salinigranum rubrum TaxID=755307 RepID=A0A2I8VIZ0_9EURY|nr:hypothetical protein [Salinigranum rubrum]AUV81888.1 hypothetical protein C2R22_09695 [Salinigranum rubrum]